MRQAITTKYHGPTNSNGSKVKAVARKAAGDMPALQLADHWDHGAGIEENHCRVAHLLAVKLGWHGLWIGGGAMDESGYVFVLVGDKAADDLAMRRDYFGIQGRDWFHVPA